MRIAVCSAVYQRAALAVPWWHGVQRIVLTFRAAGHVACAFVGGDEDVHRDLCADNGACWVEVENKPLGHKWNAVAADALSWGADYLFILGMDDFFTPSLLALYPPVLHAGHPYVGLRSLYFYHTQLRQALHLCTGWHGELPFTRGRSNVVRVRTKTMQRTAIFGCGRVLHRSLFQQPGDEFWEASRNHALDASLARRLRLPSAHLLPVNDRTAFVLDVKTASDNITPWERLQESFALPLLPDLSILAAVPEWPALLQLSSNEST